MIVSLVVGSGGLLGSAISEQLRTQRRALYVPTQSWDWQDEARFADQTNVAIENFSEQAAKADSWEIYWAAGASGMDSSQQVMEAEFRKLEIFLKTAGQSAGLLAKPGALMLSSSAGGIYAGSREAIIDESSQDAPTTRYAEGKIQQEFLMRDSALAQVGNPVFLARLSTVFGPRPTMSKRRGLITVLAQCSLQNRPARIFVSLDTVRDYIYSQDAAKVIVACMGSLDRGGKPVVKIVSSERPTSIAELLTTVGRIGKRRVSFTTSVASLTDAYQTRSRFKSCVMTEHTQFASTTLQEGISHVISTERIALASVT